MWTEFIWVSIASSGGTCEHVSENSRVINGGEFQISQGLRVS